MTDALQCKESVHDDYGVGFHRCERRAVRDGFCKQHHPDAVKARRAKSDAKWQAEHDVMMAKHEQRQADARDAKRYRALRAGGHIININGKLVVDANDLDAALDALIEATLQ